MNHEMPNRIFISGPMDGYEDYNFAAFRKAQEDLEKVGWQYIENPIYNGIGKHEPGYFHLRADFEMLCRCDAIYSLKGWEDSYGATMEYFVAINCAMVTLEQVDGMLPESPHNLLQQYKATQHKWPNLERFTYNELRKYKYHYVRNLI